MVYKEFSTGFQKQIRNVGKAHTHSLKEVRKQNQACCILCKLSSRSTLGNCRETLNHSIKENVRSVSQSVWWLAVSRITEIRFPAEEDIFHSSVKLRRILGPIQLPIQRVPGVKRPELEADHWPPSSDEDNSWTYTLNIIKYHMAWCVIKRTDFTSIYSLMIYFANTNFCLIFDALHTHIEQN